MSAKYLNRKSQVLNEVYRKEGDEQLEKSDLEGAIQKYSEALSLYPRDLKALVNRSKCHLGSKNVRKAVDDIETALHLNNLYKEALLQKADILYQTQDYDLAYIYYNRGHKVYPRNKAFIEGMKKSEHEINKLKKGKGKRQKLTPAGDLTYLIHKVPDPKPFKFQHVQDRKVKQLPSATFNQRPLCQLIRIHKTPAISLIKAVSVPDLNDISDDEGMQEKRPESRLVKSTIGEFYDDKKYLEKLASKSTATPRTNKANAKTKKEKTADKIEEEKDDEATVTDENKDGNNKNDTKDDDIENAGEASLTPIPRINVEFDETSRQEGKTTQNTKIGDDAPVWGTPLEAIANNALSFLFDRVSYWDRLGPLPPPPPIRKSKSNKKLSASTMSLNSSFSTRTVDTSTSKVTADSSYYFVEKKRAPTFKHRSSKEHVKLEPNKLNFNFTSVALSRRESRRLSRIPEERRFVLPDSETESFNELTPSGFGETPESAGQTVTDYIKKEIENINEGYKMGWIQETIGSCDSCLRLLEKYSEEDVPEKHEMTAVIHSYRGNCAVQTRKFDEALRHHNVDLSLGDKLNSRSCRFRALGNIGRVYMLQGKHQKALETLTMKAPLCKTAKESASLFHEIGNCFLALSHFLYAKDAARKSLQCSEECGDKRLQLQACVLIGLADVNMKKYKDAHKSFEEGLTHAQALGDKKAEEAMEQALVDVNKKIAHKLKTKTIHKRTDELNQQALIQAV